MMRRLKPICKFATEAEYEINGVRYIVSSDFTPSESLLNIQNTIEDRVKKYIGSDFSDLNIQEENDNILSVNTTAGKED